jgi:hypothetical protein
MTGPRRGVLLLVALASITPAARSAPPPPRKVEAGDALSVLSGANEGASLASKLRAFLLTALPDPLFEDDHHWGKKKKGPLGKTKNDGRWWKVRVTGRDLRDTLVLDLRDVRKPGPGKTTFTLFLMLDATVLLERQTWKAGVRLYSGSTRARVRLRLTLDCEAETRVEKGASWVPDAVFRLRVVRSDFRYDNLVVEHTAGVSGEAAKVLGDAVISGMKRWKPSLERNLVEKANAAIVKAGDTKEVRVSLMELMGGKSPLAPKK